MQPYVRPQGKLTLRAPVTTPPRLDYSTRRAMRVAVFMVKGGRKKFVRVMLVPKHR